MSLRHRLTTALALATLGLLLAACGTTTTPTPTATPTPSAPDVSEMWVTREEPSSFCDDGRMLLWDRSPEPGLAFPGGWEFAEGPGVTSPPAPGHDVHVQSVRFGGRISVPGPWSGDRVRIYTYPVDSDLAGYMFWPHNGDDESLQACLDQTAFLLGEGDVSVLGYLDFMLHLPEMVTRAEEEYSLESLVSLGDLALFAVTDEGHFVAGPMYSFAPPYALSVSPALARSGDMVVIEGDGFAPADGTVVVTTEVDGTREGRYDTAHVEIGRAATGDGPFRMEWTVPETIEDRSPTPSQSCHVSTPQVVGVPASVPVEFGSGPITGELDDTRAERTPAPPSLPPWMDALPRFDVLPTQQLEICVTVLDKAGKVVSDGYRVGLQLAVYVTEEDGWIID